MICIIYVNVMTDTMTILLESFRASDVRPKYRRLVDAILALIATDRLPDGTRLPPDSDMAAGLGVSLGTVQKALNTLVDEGMATRAPRRGTMIQTSKVASDVIYIFRFRDPQSGELIRPQVRMLGTGIEERPGPWRECLGGGDLVRFERLLRIGVESPVYSEVFASAAVARELLEIAPEELNGRSLHKSLETNRGAPILRSRQSVGMGPLCPVACRHLMLPEASVGLIWQVVTLGASDEPFSYQRIQLPASHRPIEFELESNLGLNRSHRI